MKQKIDILRKLVSTSKDLSKPIHYFLDLSEQSDFFESDKQEALKNSEINEELQTVILAVQKESSLYAIFSDKTQFIFKN